MRDNTHAASDEFREKAAEVVGKVREVGERLKDNVRDIGGHVRDNVREKMDHLKEKAENLREGAGEYIQSGKEKVRELENDVERFVRDKPLHALLIAGLVGLLIGLIWRKR